jgi:hypothetical protein
MKKRSKIATVHISTRMREPLRAKLETAAKARGVSLNTELVERLNRTFSSAIENALGGADVRPIVLHMIAAFRTAGETMARDKGLADWIADPECYLAAVSGVTDALLAGMPRGATDEHAAREIERLKSKLLTRIAQRKEFSDAR